jgi:uncharacterized protein
MTHPQRPPETLIAFEGLTCLARGAADKVAPEVRRAQDRGAQVLVFDAATGRVADLDLRGDDDAIRARHAPQAPVATPEATPRGRGRPKLGVTAREVTLLPRHWDWLAAQPGGASVTLRRLVEAARRSQPQVEAAREGRDAAYRFLAALAGDLPGYEEALRALFAGDRATFTTRMADWPRDVSDFAQALAFPEA